VPLYCEGYESFALISVRTSVNVNIPAINENALARHTSDALSNKMYFWFIDRPLGHHHFRFHKCVPAFL
jgi:hypothetical protein